ncbi:DNA polymerase III subunit beta [Isoalcanivorax beigongshangi]|uniref:Beta sliding clamp n=1 Tax=Isoalcanivorax beigongshangi TaxID=3238810 RepID=A0ABV4AFK4_9GAMM
MRFTINRELLLKPLQQVAGVVERRQTLPVLANVLIEVSDQRLSLTGTDLELELVARLPLEGDGQQLGETTVPARKLLDICKSLPAESEIRFEVDGERMVVRSGRSRFTLSTLPASDFPSLEEEVGGASLEIEPEQLRRLIDNTAFSMAQQDVRYYLNGMLLELGKNRLRAVATDGHRLAMADAEVAGISEEVQVIVPRKGVMELARLLGDGATAIRLTVGKNHVRLVVGDITFTTKLVDGKFPEYERVIPKDTPRRVSADRETLRQALGRVAILSNEKYRGVRLQLSDGMLRIQANNPEQEEAEEEVSVSFQGDELEIGFNVSYLIDVLNALHGTEVQLQLGDSNSSAVVVDPNTSGTLYVVMPMRL